MGSIRDFIDSMRLYGVVQKNLEMYQKAKRIGFEYLLNPGTGILHRITSDFVDSHNLHTADLGEFIGLTNIGLIELHEFPEGTVVPIYDLFTGELLDTFTINKCSHCKWE